MRHVSAIEVLRVSETEDAGSFPALRLVASGEDLGGAEDAILLNPEGLLAEGTTSNVFLVERGAVRDAHERWKGLEQREAELRGRQEEVRKKADYLRHVVGEIEKAAPRLGEDEDLETEAKRLAHADDLGRLAKDLEQALDTAALTRAAKALTGLERLDPSTAAWRELLDTAFTNVQELAATARDYAGAIDNDPARLEQVEARRDLLFRLKQKYGPTTADLLATRDRSAKELELLDTADLDLRNISAERETAAADFARRRALRHMAAFLAASPLVSVVDANGKLYAHGSTTCVAVDSAKGSR